MRLATFEARRPVNQRLRRILDFLGSAPLATRRGPGETDLIEPAFDPTSPIHQPPRDPAVASLRRCLRF